ncbi:MAG: DUF3450 domain-containing protein [Myxococcales bacterium]|nr:DUF3450 domain-containing protein [Myxococcales bacterium]
MRTGLFHWGRQVGLRVSSRFACMVLVVAVFTTIPIGATSAGDLDVAIGLVLKMNEAAAQSQKRVDKIADQTGDIHAEYRTVQQQIIALNQYNEQTQKLVDNQEQVIASLERQIGDVTNIGRGVTPLMMDMVDSLGKFIELDVPFLMEERRGRVERLKLLLDNPSVTEAERYRQIMEAYQIENEFGRTIEAFPGKLQTEGAMAREVEFLRIGRIALIYRTIDGSEMKAWNQQQRIWEPLSASYRSSVKQGFRIAQKQAAPDLFPIPIPAAEGAAQ